MQSMLAHHTARSRVQSRTQSVHAALKESCMSISSIHKRPNAPKSAGDSKTVETLRALVHVVAGDLLEHVFLGDLALPLQALGELLVPQLSALRALTRLRLRLRRLVVLVVQHRPHAGLVLGHDEHLVLLLPIDALRQVQKVAVQLGRDDRLHGVPLGAVLGQDKALAEVLDEGRLGLAGLQVVVEVRVARLRAQLEDEAVRVRGCKDA